MIDKVFELAGRIKYSPKSAPIRKFTNLLFYDPNKMLLDVRKVKVLEVGGCKFQANEALEGLVDMTDDPWLGGTREDDVVVDLGAHVGIMCVPLAKKVKKVYAIEPLYAKELRANLKLNGLDNVEVWESALGKGEPIELRYHERSASVVTQSFSNYKEKAGHIDFLKCNCEGGEWNILPREYLGIREIRLDYHIGRRGAKSRIRKAEDLIDFLECNGYSGEVKYINLGWHPQHRGFYRISASKEEE